MARKQAIPTLSFDDLLILFRFFLRELGLDSLQGLSKKLNSPEYEGVNESGNTWFYEYIVQIGKLNGAKVSAEQLRLYDENICRHTRQIAEKRGTFRWKYFQYLSLLFTEMYLDRYFSDRDALCHALNDYLNDCIAQTLGQLSFSPFTPDKMNKLAFMCATGSGKTLIMHVNILQYLHYFRRAKRLNSRLSLNKVIVLAPNEGMSRQHLEELSLSSISAALFEKDKGFITRREDVIVIDMNKLKEEGKVKTVSVDSFEQNNLVLVDEGHRGLSGNIWYDYRTRLSADGFAFEYSATFKQALNANAKKADEKADVYTEREALRLMEERGFTEYPLTYDYDMDGTYTDETEASPDSDAKHPMYQTYYVGEDNSVWTIMIVGKMIAANPVSYNLESDLDVQILVSETETLTSYTEMGNKFYTTIPKESAVLLKVVDQITSQSLNTLTFEEVINQ